MVTPSIMANSCLMGKSFVYIVPYLLSVWPAFMTCAFSSCRCVSLAITSCISCIVHTGKSTAISITSMFMLRPLISLSLFFSWLCHYSQSAINSSGPGLYNLHIVYWCMHRIKHCIPCDNFVTSLPIIGTNGYGL